MRLDLEKYSDGEIIKIVREWANASQEELANKIDKTRGTICDYEREKYTYNMTTLRRIAKELNLKITIEKRK